MHRLRVARWFCLLVLLFAVLFVTDARPQQEYSRLEIGGQYSLSRLLDASGNAQSHSGFGGRLDVNLTRRLALESQLDSFPHHASPFLQQQGDHALQALFGIRGKVIQSKHSTPSRFLPPRPPPFVQSAL